MSEQFTKLTKRQLEVFERIATNQDEGHPLKTLESLHKKGLIEWRDEIWKDKIPVVVKRYFVPMHVHIAWCQWCATLPDSETMESEQ